MALTIVSEFMVTCNKCGNVDDESNAGCISNYCWKCCYDTSTFGHCSFHLPKMESCPTCTRVHPHRCTDGVECEYCHGVSCVSCCIDEERRVYYASVRSASCINRENRVYYPSTLLAISQDAPEPP
jgi:hypothetical protein